jgi:hypothetical protein
MGDLQSELAEVREAIHALAQALELIPQIYVPQEGKAHGLEAGIFSDLVKEALSKTSKPQ